MLLSFMCFHNPVQFEYGFQEHYVLYSYVLLGRVKSSGVTDNIRRDIAQWLRKNIIVLVEFYMKW